MFVVKPVLLAGSCTAVGGYLTDNSFSAVA